MALRLYSSPSFSLNPVVVILFFRNGAAPDDGGPKSRLIVDAFDPHGAFSTHISVSDTRRLLGVIMMRCKLQACQLKGHSN
jgi:hypothetical protein